MNAPADTPSSTNRLDPWDNSGLRQRMRGMTLEHRAVERELRRVAQERAGGRWSRFRRD